MTSPLNIEGAAYQEDGSAVVRVGQRSVLELELLAGDDAQFLQERFFVQRILGPAGDILVEIDGQMIREGRAVRFVLDVGGHLLATGAKAADLTYAIVELLDGDEDEVLTRPFAVRALRPGAPTATLTVGEKGRLNVRYVGAPGASAYQQAVEAGYEGSAEAYWQAPLLAARPDGGNVQARPFKTGLHLFELSVADMAGDAGAGPIPGAQVQAALDLAAALGFGVVRVHPTRSHEIDEDLVIPVGVTLKGDLSMPGRPDTLAAAEVFAGSMWDLGFRFNVASGASIRQKALSKIDGCFFVRAGMTGPENDASSYAGTLRIPEGDDTGFVNCLAIGFERVSDCDGFQRDRVEGLLWDAVNGLRSTDTLDIPRWRDNHGWPFGTIGAEAPNHSWSEDHFLFREGAAYSLYSVNDWFEAFGCFSYGYMSGWVIAGPLNVCLINCNNDNISSPSAPYVIPGTTGVKVYGATDELTLVGHFVAAQDIGYQMIVEPGCVVALSECSGSGLRSKGVQVLGGGIVKMLSGHLRGFNDQYPGVGGTGVSVENGRFITGPGLSIEGFAVPVDGGNVKGGVVGYPTTSGGGPINMAMAEVAVADPLILPGLDEIYLVTGGGGVGTWAPTRPGDRRTLVFRDGATFYAGGNIHPPGDATKVYSARSAQTYVCDGAHWIAV